MNLDHRHIDISELKAETWLVCHYPEITEWVVNHGSFFSRNYENEIVTCIPSMRELSTSRNGLYEVLPERIFFSDDELRELEQRDLVKKEAELRELKDLIKKFFQPFDSILFNKSMEIERLTMHIEEHRIEDVLLHFFDYDLAKETNPFVRRFAPLVIYATKLRGDVAKLTQILAALLDCRVEHFQRGANVIMFIVHKEGLDSHGYREFTQQLRPLFEFLQYWFLPMDTMCGYKVKDYSKDFVISAEKPMVLDYNTHL